jgi:hypothetical protein
VTVTTASTPTELPKDVLSYSNEILAYSNDDLSQNSSDVLRHNSSDVLRHNSSDVLRHNSGDVLRRENDALMESFLLRQSDSSSGLTSDCDQVFILLKFLLNGYIIAMKTVKIADIYKVCPFPNSVLLKLTYVKQSRPFDLYYCRTSNNVRLTLNNLNFMIMH